MKSNSYSKVPVFENGLAQPVFPFTDGKTGENYDPARLCHFIKSKSSKNIVFINVFGRLIQNNTTYVNVPRRS